jgi:hypothetical protein
LIPQASGQTGEGWVTLLDEKDMGDWNLVGETNWRLEDGAVVADHRTSEDNAFLVSKEPEAPQRKQQAAEPGARAVAMALQRLRITVND